MTTKADVIAAERLLKAAVKRAVVMLRDAEPPRVVAGPLFGLPARTVAITYRYEGDVIEQAEAMLRAAGESAELLLGADQ